MIIGIDPGQFKSAYVIIDTDNSIVRKEIMDNEELVQKIRFDAFGNMEVAIEMVASYGMPVGKTTFETCLWVGRFMEAFLDKGNSVKLLYKKVHINTTICKSNKAKDSNIRQALIDMYEPTGGGKTPQIGTKSNRGPLYGVSTHIWAALAVAITYKQLKNDEPIGQVN